MCGVPLSSESHCENGEYDSDDNSYLRIQNNCTSCCDNPDHLEQIHGKHTAYQTFNILFGFTSNNQ